ncbi:acetate/propionate family kinase [Rosettibacter firmus]|uniref:acetate/propionate family kinase n=1 Tax=Rosettibacter firmus TaxID=3111522 RepID=UPI00336BF4A2
MKILIANPGSTSYKCKLFDDNFKIIYQASVERIGDKESIFTYRFNGNDKVVETKEIKNYYDAINLTLETLKNVYPFNDISAVGFKTVLAKGVTGCVRLDDNVINAMKEYRFLAPLHTDVYITAIEIFQKLLKTIPLIGLFETHFHKNIPPEAYLYGIPYEYYEKYGIRKYGFHGASHRYIGKRANELFGSNKIISCHLGGSSSVCAIKDGWSIDTSMGMSPQSGLLNAKRTGDIDPFALLYLMEKEKLSINQVSEILMSKSGLYGISGFSGDFRDIEKSMNEGNERARLAFKTFAYYVKRYIGEYIAILNGADCIVFTGGAGQNSPALRKEIISNMENIGIFLDDNENAKNPQEGLISHSSSKIKIAVIPTNEELIVASEIKNYLSNNINE